MITKFHVRTVRVASYGTPFDNLIRTGCSPWPPPEIVRSQSEFKAWLGDVCRRLDLPSVQVDDAEIFLWRRVPHPDTLVPGGPEIDVGISTANAIQLGEAKWQSIVGAAQGKMRDKDQIQLRGEFLKKYGPCLFPNRTEHIVLGISLFADAFKDTTPEGITFRSTTWENICSLDSHPHAEELRRYFNWKKEHTRVANHRLQWIAEKAGLNLSHIENWSKQSIVSSNTLSNRAD